MRIFTTAEIAAGNPSPGWAEEIETEVSRPTDVCREREVKRPNCFRESTRQDWIAGA